MIEKLLPARLNAAPMRKLSVGFIATALLFSQALGAAARGAPESFADLAEKISPSVVNITTTTMVEGRAGVEGMVPPGSPFEDFFKEFRDRNGGGGDSAPQKSQALGSGFVISEDGYIVTNNHVIEGADEIQIEFYGGEELPAKLIGTDPNTDIALLKVEADKPLDYVKFGNSDTMRVGDWVVAMGNPLGQGFSVSAGIVSARNRELRGSYDDYIQTDAAINKGNSGGPLFNMDGDVIGVNTAILSPNGGSIGIGFSMASNVVDKVVGQLKEFGETRRGWLGVRIQDITKDMAEAIAGLEGTDGVMVSEVTAGGPSEAAGLKTGDVIKSFDGTEVKDSRELVRKVGDTEVGKAVDVVILRDGKTQTVAVTLGLREDEKLMPAAQKSQSAPAEDKDILGMKLAEINDDLRSQLGLDSGAVGLVVRDIDETSAAFDKGLRAGDVIEEIAQTKVTTLDDFQSQIDATKDAGRKSVLLLIRRGGEPRFVALPVQD